MKIGPLSLFNNHIAAWHWSWSLTWRWVLSIHHHKNLKLGFFAMRTHCGGGILCGLNTPLIDVVFESQPNMRRKV